MLVAEVVSGYGEYEKVGFESCGYLKYGSRGYCVGELQRMLNDLGYKIKIDGAFGVQTRNAVVSFQRTHGLKPDGVVGPNTWNKLKSLFKPVQRRKLGFDWAKLILIGAGVFILLSFSFSVITRQMSKEVTK